MDDPRKPQLVDECEGETHDQNRLYKFDDERNTTQKRDRQFLAVTKLHRSPSVELVTGG